jgi:hypothetical protein
VSCIAVVLFGGEGEILSYNVPALRKNMPIGVKIICCVKDGGVFFFNSLIQGF